MLHWLFLGAIIQNGAFFVAVPLVECRGNKKPPLIEMWVSAHYRYGGRGDELPPLLHRPGIPAALALLEGIAEVLGPNIKDLDEVQLLYIYV